MEIKLLFVNLCYTERKPTISLLKLLHCILLNEHKLLFFKNTQRLRYVFQSTWKSAGEGKQSQRVPGRWDGIPEIDGPYAFSSFTGTDERVLQSKRLKAINTRYLKWETPDTTHFRI